ncbi:VOC family protein [Rhodobacteraceae bacterium]|nr:VOC family protein [Paracoccaceae bacterium]
MNGDGARPALKGIHHVALIAGEYARSRQFYTEVLGFSVLAETFRPERESWKLDLEVPGGTQLEVFSFPDAPLRPSYPEARGLRHLAFAVPDLPAWARYLTAQGQMIEPIRTDALTGKTFFFFQDPDGLPIELYEA